ncbi:MAG: hypothetical protein HOJ35_09530 [Bdellovibrionales bacterium]|jgi:hypothetical protein|nr:hypothetical protein [Bdellovibrionales bacterium]
MKLETSEIIHDVNSTLHGLKQAVEIINESNHDPETIKIILPLLSEKIDDLQKVWPSIKKIIKSD